MSPPLLDPAVLPLLRCPVTHQPLRMATDEEKATKGIPLAEAALASEDGTHLYGAPEGLPVLLSANEVTAAEAG